MEDQRRRVNWPARCGVATLLLAACLAPALSADGPAAKEDPVPPALAGRPIGRLAHEVLPKLRELRRDMDLQPAQWEAIRGVLKSHDTELRAVGRRLREGHREVAEAIRAEPLDEAAVRAAASDLARAIGDAAVLRARVQREVKPHLTAEQIATLEAFRQQVEQSVDRVLAEPAQ